MCKGLFLVLIASTCLAADPHANVKVIQKPKTVSAAAEYKISMQKCWNENVNSYDATQACVTETINAYLSKRIKQIGDSAELTEFVDKFEKSLVQ